MCVCVRTCVCRCVCWRVCVWVYRVWGVVNNFFAFFYRCVFLIYFTLNLLYPEGRARVTAFGSVCLNVRARNCKTIGPIDMIFVTQDVVYSWLGPPRR